MSSKSRRILIVATSYLPLVGGAELAVKNITDRLPDFAFDLVTGRYTVGEKYDPSLPAQERIGNVNIYRAGWPGVGVRFLVPKAVVPLAIFFKALPLLRSRAYDLVYGLQASQATGALWLLNFFGLIRSPILIGIQEGKDLATQSWLLRVFRHLIFKTADHFAVISTYLKDYLISYGIQPQRIHVIPNGVDTALFSEKTVPQSPRFGGADSKIIMTVSRLAEKNGIADLIDGFALLGEQKTTGNLQLVIIGTGPLADILEAKARALSCAERIHFSGEVPYENLPGYLSMADVFVRPSLSEGLGTAFLEAMAVGVPVVGTAVGGIPDFLRDGETGVFCRPRDPQSVAVAIERILSDEMLRERIVTNAHALVNERYQWQQIAEQFRNLYESITNR